MVPVKKVGLVLLNPVTSVNKKDLSSQPANTELIRSVTGEEWFSIANRLLALREEIFDGQKI